MFSELEVMQHVHQTPWKSTEITELYPSLVTAAGQNFDV